jgi:hypothetical protein
MNKIYVLVLAAIGLLLLIAGPSLGKLHVANCGKHSASHAATRCHISHHRDLYRMALRANVYAQADEYDAIYPVGSPPFYYGTDPDPRIRFELHRDPGWARSQ